VSVTEKVPEGIRYGSTKTNNRELPYKRRKSKMASKLNSFADSGKVWRKPVYWPSGARHKDSVILVWALALNYRNLRWRCQGKGTSVTCEADSTDAPSRDGVTGMSVEGPVMGLEQSGHVIQSCGLVNCMGRRIWSV
jgi:hypothetical protein